MLLTSMAYKTTNCKLVVSEAYLDSNTFTMFKPQKSNKDIVKIVMEDKIINC